MTDIRRSAMLLIGMCNTIGALLLATACTATKTAYTPNKITCQMQQTEEPVGVGATKVVLDAFARSNVEQEILVVHHEMMSGRSDYRRLIRSGDTRYLIRTTINGVSDTIQLMQDIKLNQLGVEKLVGHFFSMELSITDAPYYGIQIKQAGVVTSSYSYTGSFYCLSSEDQAKVKQLYELGKYILSL